MRNLALIALFFASTAQAADLEAFLEAAAQNNPDVAVAVARYDQQRAGVDIARGQLLPSLTASAGYQRNFPPVEIVLPGTGTSVNITPEDQVTAQVRLTVPLFVPQAIAATQAAGANKRAGASNRDLATENALLSVVRAYWTAVSTGRVEKAAAESEKAAATSFELAKARYELNGTSALDLKRAEADLARARQTRLAAEADRKDADRNLKTITGLAESPDGTAKARAMPQGDLQGRATEGNAQIKAARDALAAARLQTAQQAWAYSPTISGSGVMNVTNATGFAGKPVTGNAGVTLSWTLADGGAREGRWAQARAAVRENEARLEGLELALKDDVDQAQDTVAAMKASVEATAVGLAASSEAVRLADERFRLGELDANQLTQARRDAFDAEVSAARAEANLALAIEQLRLLVGEGLVATR